MPDGEILQVPLSVSDDLSRYHFAVSIQLYPHGGHSSRVQGFPYRFVHMEQQLDRV